MSAQLKTAKKKYTQNDLRRLMQEQKSKTQQRVVEQKIDSPLAKYNDQGQLTCILCKSVVRSESVWKVHINTKAHKANVEIAKQLKEQLKDPNKAAPTSQLKRTHDTPVSVTNTSPVEKKPKIENAKQNTENNKSAIPSDFFDNSTKPKSATKTEPTQENQTKVESEAKDELPEGFFDDPVKDAKIRNLEYKDPQDEEWERFQREIKEEATLSNTIIAGEQEEATAERQIKEIDEQIEKWTRVLDLEKKKEVVADKLRERPSKMDVSSSDEDEDSEGDDEEFEEFPDWRAKEFHR